MSSNFNKIYQESLKNPEEFWKKISEDVFWFKKPTKILSKDNPPFYKWFTDGVTNTCYNALDVHIDQGRGDKTALIYDSPITGNKKQFSYKELRAKVSKFAGALKNQGVDKGDRVIIYMPMIPEAVVAMLACGRIGAIHSVVFGGFASNELASRIDDSKAKLLVTASCGFEPGMPGVQTLLPVMLNHVNDGKLKLEQLIKLLCENPVKIFGIQNKGFIKKDFDADFTVVDINREIEIKNEKIESKCKWSPFDGKKFKGCPVSTIIGGRIKVKNGEILGDAEGKPIVFN